MEFTTENLVQFELEFFKVPSKYQGQRYGQALNNVFDFDEKYQNGVDELFYDSDDSYCRDIALLTINNLCL